MIHRVLLGNSHNTALDITTSNIGVSLISLHHTPRPHTLNRVIRNLMRLAHI